jgi:hypothetical protein
MGSPDGIATLSERKLLTDERLNARLYHPDRIFGSDISDLESAQNLLEAF